MYKIIITVEGGQGHGKTTIIDAIRPVIAALPKGRVSDEVIYKEVQTPADKPSCKNCAYFILRETSGERRIPGGSIYGKYTEFFCVYNPQPIDVSGRTDVPCVNHKEMER